MSMRTPRQVLSQSSPPYSYDDSHYADVLSGSGRPHRRPENVDNDLDEFDRSVLHNGYIEFPQQYADVKSDEYHTPYYNRLTRDRISTDNNGQELARRGRQFDYAQTPCLYPVAAQDLSSSPTLLPSSPTTAMRQRRKQLGTSSFAELPFRMEGDTVYAQGQEGRTRLLSGLQGRSTSQYQPAGSGLPTVQGVELVFRDELPDRFRSIFPFNPFNAVQSRCFDTVYRSDDNFVLAAPTGSGKTVILELAICRLISTLRSDRFKIVYQAPTKALCSERQRDWEAKFAFLDIRCAELTGDTNHVHLRNVQHANIIITTPEKWDSVTRKWKDHTKLMQMVKLFLIDEVHILNDSRGATLEAVVSRMKSIGSDVRFLALSATVPNLEDVAQWLGRNVTDQSRPARYEKFGEEFRPVQLQKHVVGYQSGSNDFAFDKVCEAKLPEVISKYSCKKPVLVFCCTRSSTISTAKSLAKWWASIDTRDRCWPSPTLRLGLHDGELRNCAGSGVAFHHGGLDVADRQLVEKAYQEGQISVICCTSTLAVGVNLPCHFVIIKNTMSWQGASLREYLDLEIMQMLGRAGRPQFDKTAVAVIMTRKEKVNRYEKMVSGSEILESSLHLNLIEHLNAEISLGSVRDVESAKVWLKGTFLYVRLMSNPNYYKLDCDTRNTNIDQRLEDICARDIMLLQETDLVTSGTALKCSEFGDAMARYYVKFATMKVFLELKEQARVPDILSSLSQADEFRDLRFKAGEKALYKEFNKANAMRYPIKVDLALYAHKTSLIIQAELGGVDYPSEEQYQKYRQPYNQDKGMIFQQVHRLVRCIVDCKLHKGDSVSVRNGLELARSLAARVWDNSPLQLKQVDQLGPVAVRKLVVAGITSIEALEHSEGHRIEMILSRHPPFGSKILAKVKEIPNLKVTASVVGKEVRGGHVRVKVKAGVGFVNERVPTVFRGKVVFVCFLAEISDGQLIEFGRLSSRKLAAGDDITFTAALTDPSQHINFYAMCEEIAGSLRSVELKPGIPPSWFPTQPKPRAESRTSQANATSMNIAKPRSAQHESSAFVHESDHDEYGDDDMEDEDIQRALGDLEYHHIDVFDDDIDLETQRNTVANQRANGGNTTDTDSRSTQRNQLESGKWACNHKCKDKTACKHLCCREGLDKPPKDVKNFQAQASSSKRAQQSKPWTDPKPLGVRPKYKSSDGRSKTKGLSGKDHVEVVNLAKDSTKESKGGTASRTFKKLDTLHSKVQKNLVLRSPDFKKPTTNPTLARKGDLSFRSNVDQMLRASKATNLESDTELNEQCLRPSSGPAGSEYDDSLTELEQAMVGLDDSVILRESRLREESDRQDPETPDEDNDDLNPYGFWSSSPVRHSFESASPVPSRMTLQEPASGADVPLFVNPWNNRKAAESMAMADLEEIPGEKRKTTTLADEADVTTDRTPKKQRKSPGASGPLAQIDNVGGSPAAVSNDLQLKSMSTIDGIDPDLLAEFGDIIEFQ